MNTRLPPDWFGGIYSEPYNLKKGGIMIKIQKLAKPGKRSGYELASGETTKVRGVVITNQNSFSVYVDKFGAKTKAKPKKK